MGFGPEIVKHLAEKAWPLIVGMGIYDITTRRRLHPVYAIGTAWVFANQLTAVSLLLSPAWKPWALRLIGH